MLHKDTLPVFPLNVYAPRQKQVFLLPPDLPHSFLWRAVITVSLSASAYGLQKKNGTIFMATEKAQNVQDVFLNHVRKTKTPVTVFLVNGVKLQGIITWFDNFSMLLRRDGHTQLVYKHAISTVMPGGPIQLFDGPKADDASASREMAAADLDF
jgi:host factor-I protein